MAIELHARTAVAEVPTTVASPKARVEVDSIELILVPDGNVEVETKLEESVWSKELDIVEIGRLVAIPTQNLTKIS